MQLNAVAPPSTVVPGEPDSSTLHLAAEPPLFLYLGLTAVRLQKGQVNHLTLLLINPCRHHMLSRPAARIPLCIHQAICSTPSSCSVARPVATAGSSRQAVLAGAGGAAAASTGDITPSTSNPLISWVISNGGTVNGVGMANLAGSDGGSGWGLVAAQVWLGFRGRPVGSCFIIW